MRSPADDLALIERCKGDLPDQERAFEQLAEKYQDMVYTLCYRMTGNNADAEDLMQEVLTKVFLNIRRFEGRSAFSTWLYRLAHNHCLNFLAKRNIEEGRSAPLPEGDVTPDVKTEYSQQDELTRSVLASMEPQERALLIMKYVMDLDIQEISGVLHIGASATKMRLARARGEFKRLMREPR